MNRVRLTLCAMLVVLGLTLLCGCTRRCVAYWWEPCGYPDCPPCGDPCDPCDTRG